MPIQIYAQHENDNWLFGKGLGMVMKTNSLNVLNAPAHASQRYITSTVCQSDKQSGSLLFYSNGQNVYNRIHKIMPSGVLSSTSYYQYMLIVPDPGDSLKYYLLYMSNSNLKYARIDMRLNGGFGDVIEKDKDIETGLDDRFTAVKQLYNNGYWIIVHQTSTHTFKSIRLTTDGFQTKSAVTSNTSELVFWPSGATFYSEMITNSDGTKLAVMDNNSGKATDKFILIYDFDKRCGTVTFNKHILSKPFIYDIAWDNTARWLYVLTSQGGGDRNIIQYDMESDPDLHDTLGTQVLITSNEPMRHLKLGPYGRIFITKEEMIGNGYSPSRYLDEIRFPSIKGIGCGYVEKAYNLSLNNQCPNEPCYLTDRLPNFMQDRSLIQPPGFEEPKPVATGYCLGESSNFNQPITDIICDSFYWDFGDGEKLYQNNGTHTYLKAGNFITSYNWFLCGQHYIIKMLLNIGRVPRVKLGNDTTLCNGHTYFLHPDTISEKYYWSTGDTSFQITISKPGKYSITMSNGNCSANGEINIDYYPPLFTQLGEEYFICDRDKELIKLDAGEGFKTYKWTPTGDTSQWIIVGDLGSYFVVVNDFRGCDGTDGTVVKRICTVELFFPNAFTPNQDGVNDIWLPIGNSVIKYDLNIYNRWGELIYQTSDVNAGWNGISDGKAANTDVYYYICNYGGFVNKRWKEYSVKGNFTLLR